MTDRAAQAPLFVDALALCQWLTERFGAAGQPLEQRLIAVALAVLETLTLALKGRDRDARIEEVDELLLRLRTLLRLAVECGRLTADQPRRSGTGRARRAPTQTAKGDFGQGCRARPVPDLPGSQTLPARSSSPSRVGRAQDVPDVHRHKPRRAILGKDVGHVLCPTYRAGRCGS